MVQLENIYLKSMIITIGWVCGMDVNVDLNVIFITIAITIIALVAMFKGYEFQLITRHFKISLTTPK